MFTGDSKWFPKGFQEEFLSIHLPFHYRRYNIPLWIIHKTTYFTSSVIYQSFFTTFYSWNFNHSFVSLAQSSDHEEKDRHRQCVIIDYVKSYQDYPYLDLSWPEMYYLMLHMWPQMTQCVPIWHKMIKN